MLKKVIEWMDSSAYMGRLAKTFPMFVFVLVLQLFLCVHYFSALSVGELGWLTYLQVLVVETIRSAFWASWAWGVVACPKSKRWQNWLGFIFVLFFAVLHLFESYLLGKYGEGYTFSVVNILMGTTVAESSEYLATVLSLTDFVRGSVELVLSLGITYVVSLFFGRIKYRRKIYPLVWLIGLACLGNIFVLIPRVYLFVVWVGAPLDYVISPVDRLIWNTTLAYKEAKTIEENIEKIESIDLGNLKVRQPYGQINVVVVIGESLRRGYMHCYGYPLDNTPKLDSLISDGSIILYSNVISPATSTINSLTKVLTYLSLNSPGAWYNYPNLTNVLSRCGYETYWVSNQEVVGDAMQPLSVIAKMSGKIDYVKMRTAVADFSPVHNVGHDMEVLPYLHKYGSQGKANVAQFIHLIGSHIDYSQRYPVSYERFTSKDIVAEGDKACIAHYVNSIYYNDDVVTNIIKHYQNQKTLLFYFSDHGESLFDAPNKPTYFGHILSLKSNVEIPFMVYMSPQLREEHPELYERILRYKDRPIVNDLFTNSLLELLGITNKYSDPKLEFFSDGYDEARPRVPVTMNRKFSYNDAP